MKKSGSRNFLRTSLFSFILLAGPFLAYSEWTLATAEARDMVDCPAQTVQQGNYCTLKKDIVLQAPIDLPSDTKLDCKGHKIMPSQAGEPDNPSTQAFDPVFSQPQLAVFMNGVHGIILKDCVIDGGFDFGVLAINSKDTDSKRGPRNKIFNNTIEASYVALHLMASDYFEIKQNRLIHFVRGGASVLLDFNSDNNIIENNTVIGDLKAVGAPAVPGPTGVIATMSAPGGLTSNQVATFMTGAVLITQNLGPHSALFNVVIERTPPNPPDLYQLTVPNVSEINEDFTADNLVEGNDVSYNLGQFPGASQSRESGIAAPSALRTTVLNNFVHGISGIGVRDGQTTARVFPEKCSLDSTRYCMTDADCLIEGIDEISKGTCPIASPPPLQNVEWSSRDFLIEGNQIEGPFTGGISVAARNATIRGNTVIGPLGQGGLGGIALRGKSALETGTVVTRNTVSNVSIALHLDNTFGVLASFFNAQISLNDFTDYTIGVKTTNFNSPSELSVDGKGNYWGLSCEEGGFDPARVSPINPDIVDSHPYGEPVAGTPDDLLPLTCF